MADEPSRSRNDDFAERNLQQRQAAIEALNAVLNHAASTDFHGAVGVRVVVTNKSGRGQKFGIPRTIIERDWT